MIIGLNCRRIMYMTIHTYNTKKRFAFTPKVCSKCNRKFIFEIYKLKTEICPYISIPIPIENIYCKNCWSDNKDD